MSVDKFIAGLEERGLLSDRLTTKLREKLARSERPLNAKAIAKFLVEKEHLTQQQATEVLGSLERSGVNLDESAPEAPNGQNDDAEITPIISPPSAVEISDNSVRQVSADEADDTEGSSIFEAFPSAVIDERADDNTEDFRLAPDSELDVAEPDRRSSPKEPVSEEDADVAPLGDMFGKPAKREAEAAILEERSMLDEPLESPVADAPATLAKKVRRRKKSKSAKRANEWDSPLLLLGGGGLVLLVLGGLTIAWLLNTESADQKLTSAEKAVDAGSYSQAISEYQDFLEDFPRHRNAGLARVKLAMVQLRKATEAANYEIALDVARSNVEAVEDEEKFGEVAHGELAALLPRIALGLAEQAEATGDPAAAQKLVEQATAALVLTNNTKYVPKSFRDETELADVRETLSRIERRQQSQQDLQQTIAAMEQAISAGETRAAYDAHVAFIKKHPSLAAEPGLKEAIQKTTAAESEAVRFIAEEQPAETSERKTPWLASLALANRRTAPASRAAPGPGASPPIACLRINGAAYAFDAASGQLRWRRRVGNTHAAWPIAAGNDFLVSDEQHEELLRLHAESGKLVWRQTIGEPFAEPLVVGPRAFVAAESGRLYVIDLKSGTRTGYIQFAQPLRVTPSTDREQMRLYLPGEHSSLYAISLADLNSLGVHYLGHAAGSITVPLTPVLNKLVVLENDGVETSRLRLLSVDENGAIGGQVLQERLAGLATSPPFVAGRRLIVATNRGQIDVYEVATAEDKNALTLVATRAATGTKPLVRYAALTGNHIWVGDTQLTKYSILPTGNRLPVESIENNFERAAFDHPLALIGKTLIHARRPRGRAGVVVAAVDTAQGRIIWETDVAMPPAGSPIVDKSTKSFAIASAEGHVFRFDEAAIRARVQDEPLVADMMPAKLPALSFAVDLGQGRAVFGAPEGDQLLLYNPSDGENAARWISLESPLACAVTPLGNGFVAPLNVGQVFYLSSTDGSQLAAPFQPLLGPGATWNYQPAGALDDQQRFVIADGNEKVYLVSLANGSRPHLQAAAESTAKYQVGSPFVVLGDSAIAIGGSSHLVRFQLPSLEYVGDSNLPAPVSWGPYRAGDALLLVTANNRLLAVSAAGDIAWDAPIEHGDLAGAPLVRNDEVILAYRSGVVERRALADGKPLAATDLGQPLAAGPVFFLQRLLLTASDGTLLVADAP